MAVLLSVVGASSSFIVRSATLFIKTAHKRYDWLKSTNLYSNLLSARHSCSTARSAPTRSPSSYHTRIRRKRTLRCAAPLRLDLCNIWRDDKIPLEVRGSRGNLSSRQILHKSKRFGYDKCILCNRLFTLTRLSL
ncbi:hypothetical protein PR003_g30192 [Phytophthora rubi]|uniref:Uncharacterized protein n=1 Tax=Phytophthora rubi TaxID=129364 RepID=A0A6A3H334_9STRA|nr:hypothetical protein PR002_g29289 [Phytophthora rubi]KAE9272471.1 hypothetical protein PR003_g30192 [Phytophthora rubi]